VLLKSDTVLKHLGKCFDDKGNLVDRKDRYSGTLHSKNVKVYEEALRKSAKPGTVLQLHSIRPVSLHTSVKIMMFMCRTACGCFECFKFTSRHRPPSNLLWSGLDTAAR
jgi:hypothetical protein